MTAVQRSGVGEANGASATALTVTKPAAAADGDIIVAAIFHDSDGLGITISPPDGSWTEWFDLDSPTPGGQVLYVASKIASGEPASWTFTASSAVVFYVSAALAFFDDAGGSVSAYGGTAAEDTAPPLLTPSLTTTAPNDYVVSFYAQNNTVSDGNYGAAHPQNLVELYETWLTATNLGCGVFGELRERASAAAHTVTQYTGGAPTRGGATGLLALHASGVTPDGGATVSTMHAFSRPARQGAGKLRFLPFAGGSRLEFQVTGVDVIPTDVFPPGQVTLQAVNRAANF